ncbi:MAG: outer membrane protein assembly factor BamD [Nitrospiraceae bacterium]|nr:outer membrane protein assembly factor BamD [Nitrospiraceae bacterium]
MKIFKTILLILSLAFVISCSGKTSIQPDAKFDAEKTFAKANDLIEKKEYEDARTVLLEIKNRDHTKKYAPLAQLKLADTFLKDEDPDRAIEEYRKFTELYPDHKYASYAQYQIGNIYFNQIDGPERGSGAAFRAMDEFEKLKKMFPRNPYKEIVESRIEMCKDIISDYEFIVGNFYYKKDAYKAAITRFEGLLKKFPETKKEASVLYYLGLSYKALDNKEKAAEYFKRVVEKYPQNNIAYDAKKELSSLNKK